MSQTSAAFGDLVRGWRERRRLSQLGLSAEAEVSQKHLSFIESGRSSPSREMVLKLAEHLDVPLRDRNALLLAAGFAPVYGDRPLSDPALSVALASIDKLLKAHEPFPALTLDRHWNIISVNSAVMPLMTQVDPDLLEPPANILKICLHPRGLAPHIVNLGEWTAHLVDRVRRQIRLTRDATLERLLREVTAYPLVGDAAADAMPDRGEVARPLKLRTNDGELSLLSTVTVFGTPTEIALSELTFEAFYPADEASAAILRGNLSPPCIE